MDTAERIRGLVAPLVTHAGAELYDVEFTGGVLRISVDPDGGVDMAVIARLSREVSQLLDESDPIAGHYTLEVSSPGLERPLRTPEHFARAVGAAITVKTRVPVDGTRRTRGILVAAETDHIDVEPADAVAGTVRRLAMDDIDRARTVFEWGPAPKPGGRSTPSAKKKKKAAKS